VKDTLRRIADAGVILGLLSGAMEGAARIKMEPGKLGRYFVFGAYGSDSPDRAEITRLAMAKAARLHGRDLTRSDVYVVGGHPLATSRPRTRRMRPRSGLPAATTASRNCVPPRPTTCLRL
jgi:hypothetical protein